MPLPNLPIFYYHDHFLEMLDAVERAYAAILAPEHHGFIARFRSLSRDAQCLYIRMANRRGRVFHHSALTYAEIDFTQALVELHKEEFAGIADTNDLPHVLATLNKIRLITLAQQMACTDFRASWPKARLIMHVSQAANANRLPGLIEIETYAVRQHIATLDFLLFLYFGKTHRNLKSFALRDLGIVATIKATSLAARFIDAGEAEACFTCQILLMNLTPTIESHENAAAVLVTLPPAPTDYAAAAQAKLALAVAGFFEKSGDVDRAIELYKLADAPECNERLARLLYTAGRQEEAKTLLERMIDDPGSDQEYDFAVDYYARKFDRQRIGAATALLRGSTSISIDELYRNNPETGAAAAFEREGWTVYWTENGFWHVLFGLVFWDELFGDAAILHSGFDYLPHCLAAKTFHTLYADNIAARLDIIRRAKAPALIRKTVKTAAGILNGLIAWDDLDIDPIIDCLEHAPPQAMATILEMMTRDFHGFRDGFPDLMLVKNGALRFIEIKSEGDAIRRNQLTRLRQLNRAGFDAAIARVDYRFDPDQVYVVVDIETTGGRAASHRVIEIGAVKIRNHQIIDEFHTLIDPEYRIPRFITNLTGIDDDMVADAPVFSAIADDFENFMNGAIFAAHNVNFDYGFLAQEYRRLERVFRYPKFCTCAQMRRHYPGHASYSLGTLCAALDIQMERHHRALSDAKAAASLLSLINQKRSEVAERSAA